MNEVDLSLKERKRELIWQNLKLNWPAAVLFPFILALYFHSLATSFDDPGPQALLYVLVGFVWIITGVIRFRHKDFYREANMVWSNDPKEAQLKYLPTVFAILGVLFILIGVSYQLI